MDAVSPFVHLSAPCVQPAQEEQPDQLRDLKARVAAIQEEIKKLEDAQALKGNLPIAAMQNTIAPFTPPISPHADPVVVAVHPPAKRRIDSQERSVHATKLKTDTTQLVNSFLFVQSQLVKLFSQMLIHQGSAVIYPEIQTLVPSSWEHAKSVIFQISNCMTTLNQLASAPNFHQLSKDLQGDICCVQRIWKLFSQSLQSDYTSSVIPTKFACQILGAKESRHRPLNSRLRICENATGNDLNWNLIIETLFLLRQLPDCHHEHLLQLLLKANEYYQDHRRFYGEISMDVSGSEVFYFSFTLDDLLKAKPVARGVPFNQMRELDWVWQAPQAIVHVLAKRILSQGVDRLFASLERKEIQQARDRFFEDFERAEKVGFCSEVGVDLLQMLDAWLLNSWLDVSVDDKIYHLGIRVEFLPLEIVTRYLFAPKKKPVTFQALMNVLQRAVFRYIPVQKCIDAIKQIKHTSQEFLIAIKELPITLYLYNPDNPLLTITLAEVEAGGNNYLTVTLQQALRKHVTGQVPDENFWNQLGSSQS